MPERPEEHTPEPHPTPAGQYYLMEKIAQGGMAEIFKGLSYDVHGIKKTVCIKKILPNIAASKEFIDTLIDEAKIAVSLSHGNIAQTFDLGKVGEDYFMVMEYVEGRTLSQIFRRCKREGTFIPIPHLCYFISEVLNGLNYMHGRKDERGKNMGIVHRDISPQNIMISYSGTVKIIDFGIAKARIKVGNTDSGILKGKFAYMSPEQARGDPLDHRSDIFSLGIIFHELLTGERLFKAEENRDTLRNVRKAKVPTPSSLRPELPPELDEIVLRALSKDRRERYPFASEMHDELIKFLYTTYPEFKPADVTTFLTELFKDDLMKAGEEKEAGTPYLIIDHTNSAIMEEQYEDTGIAKAPIDMKEYVVGEMPEREREEETPATGEEKEIEPEKPPISREETSVETRMERRGGSKLLYFSIGLALILAAVAIGLWQWAAVPDKSKPPVGSHLGKILVTTEPSDAKVFVDGEMAGQGSPVTVTDIGIDDSHLLTVQKDGFITKTIRFKLKADEFKDFSVNLKPAKVPTSTIVVSSTPNGATVFLNDVETKHRTPATISDLEPNKKHTLGLHLANHRFWTSVFTARPNETQNFHVQLALDFGSLKVTTKPKEALIMINGSPVGQTPLMREDLEPGKTYKVEVWMEGYQPMVREVFIKAGKQEELHLELTRTPKPTAPPPIPARQAPPTPMGPAAPR
jgi:serine/threonine protein kinase